MKQLETLNQLLNNNPQNNPILEALAGPIEQFKFFTIIIIIIMIVSAVVSFVNKIVLTMSIRKIKQDVNEIKELLNYDNDTLK